MLAVIATPAFADERTIAARVDAKDTGSAKTAIALTKALRVAAKSKTSAKDFDDAVAAADCAMTRPSCAASIGAALGVTHILVGQLERRGSRSTVTLSLINVQTKQRVRSIREAAPAKLDVRRWARTLHARMLDDGTGELLIVANAKRGQILIDGLAVGELFEGRATLAGIALGTHQLEIRANGYRPFSTDVSVDGRSEQTLLLEPAP